MSLQEPVLNQEDFYSQVKTKHFTIQEQCYRLTAQQL